jgi:hypothetical protein
VRAQPKRGVPLQCAPPPRPPDYVASADLKLRIMVSGLVRGERPPLMSSSAGGRAGLTRRSSEHNTFARSLICVTIARSRRSASRLSPQVSHTHMPRFMLVYCLYLLVCSARASMSASDRAVRLALPAQCAPSVAQDARQCAPKPITNQEAGMDAGAHGDNKAAGQKDHPPKTAQRPAALQLCTCLFSTERLRTTPGREVLSPSSRACV